METSSENMDFFLSLEAGKYGKHQINMENMDLFKVVHLESMENITYTLWKHLFEACFWVATLLCTVETLTNYNDDMNGI